MPRNDWVGIVNQNKAGLSTDGNTLATFTTSAALFGDTAGSTDPVMVFPANFWQVGRLVHIRARGIYGCTATPTLTFRLQSIVGTVVTVVTSAAITLASGVTNQAWELDLQVQGRTMGTTGTVLAFGDLNLGLTATTSTTYYLPASGTAPATATINTGIAQTWSIEVACSASSASNTVKGIILEVKSIN